MNDRSNAPEQTSASEPSPPLAAPTDTSPLLVFFAWLFVGAPLLWGVLQTLKKAAALFQ